MEKNTDQSTQKTTQRGRRSSSAPAKAQEQKREGATQEKGAVKPATQRAPKPRQASAKAAPQKAQQEGTAPQKARTQRQAGAKGQATKAAPAKATPQKAQQESSPAPRQRGRRPSSPAKAMAAPGQQAASKGKLKVIFLGGVEEIGKNITVLEYAEDIVIVDCGSIFPKEDLLGIDLVIPDVGYLQRNRDKIRGILVTHGHEDHIGAIPYVVKILGGVVPIYATKLTMALIDLKLKEHKAAGNVAAHIIAPGQHVNLGSTFQVDFVHMSHSIAGAVAMAIKTPMGRVVFTGDFKVDYTPVDGEIMDIQALAEMGKEGVLALFMDSTNAERPGYTMSESTVGATFDSLFPQARGRIIIAMFASNVHRVQQVVESAIKYGRKVCITGRSMINVSTVARNLGILSIPSNVLIDIDDLDQYPDEEIVVITTGSQGEQMSGLTRMAFSEHRKLDIRASDMVVLSAHAIPGNELSVSKVIDQLLRKGANVIYDSLAEVHVSGHACQEELKLIHALLRPQFFIPVHGEFRMLSTHKRIAVSMGMKEENVYIPRLGDCLELTRDSMKLGTPVPAGAVLVDGLGIGDIGNVVLRDRKHLSQDGLMVIVIGVSNQNPRLASGPDIITRGFVYVRENEQLMDDVREQARKTALDCLERPGNIDFSNLRLRLRDDMHEFLYHRTKRNPMILPVVMEV